MIPSHSWNCELIITDTASWNLQKRIIRHKTRALQKTQEPGCFSSHLLTLYVHFSKKSLRVRAYYMNVSQKKTKVYYSSWEILMGCFLMTKYVGRGMLLKHHAVTNRIQHRAVAPFAVSHSKWKEPSARIPVTKKLIHDISRVAERSFLSAIYFLPKGIRTISTNVNSSLMLITSMFGIKKPQPDKLARTRPVAGIFFRGLEPPNPPLATSLSGTN